MTLTGVLRIAFLLVVLWPCTGLAGDGRLVDFFRESWTTRDGLPHNTINGIAQSSDGYLWLSTWEGAVRFNGREFKSYGRSPETGLLDNGVFTLKVCSENMLLADARGGVSRIRNNQWQRIAEAGVLIRSIHCDAKGNLWLGTEGEGVYVQRVDGERLHYDATSGLTDQSIYQLLEDNTGRVWIGTAQGLFVLDNGHIKLIEPSSGLPLGPVFDLVHDPQGRLLAATESGIYRLQEDHFHILTPGLQDVAVLRLLVDTDDQLWIGTVGDGLYRLSPLGLEHLGTEMGLPNSRVTALFKDRENSLWVGTNGGLFRLREAPFRAVGKTEGLSDNFVRVVMAHQDGTLWIGNSKGVDILKRDEIQRLAGQSTEQTILSLAQETDGSVWVGTFTNGLFKWQDGQQTVQLNREHGLVSNEVRALLPATDGSLWIGTSRGLNRLTESGLETFTRAQGLPSNFIAALHETDDGRIWIGGATGFAFWQQGEIQVVDINPFEAAEFVFGFYQDRGSDALWLATDRGLIRYHLPSGEMQSIGRAQGLPFDKYFQMLGDERGNYWVSSNRGILRLERQQVDDLVKGLRQQVDVELFGESDGMYSAQANGGSMPAATLAQDGSLWFAMAKGLASIQPESLNQFSRVSPPVVVEGVVVDGQVLMPQAKLTLSPGISRIQFEFAGLGYIMPQRIQYQTRLDGFDSQWVLRNNQTVTEFTNLSPGDYRFRVRGRYPNGQWSEQEATIDIHLRPHLWQRKGFWFAVFVICASLILVAVRLRLRVLHRFNRLLQKQVARQTQELRRTADSLRQADTEKSALLSQLKLQSEAFERQARQDPLTGLANRRAFDEVLQREFARATRQKSSLCLLLLDLDHFKRINDQWSHNVGDKVLKRVAKTIQSACRETDFAARWGGEEFVILLPDTDLASAEILANRICHNLSQLDLSSLAQGLHLTTSIGLATIVGCDKADEILQRADTALYQAKEAGRNQVCLAG
ncbi:diguanylate cyclase [Aliiglaciecola sp. CAU 1673]|uniref:ligand-binding sensor domain-containing diguanylate cyclase n=1 Tax=Aliiglaciecola sp. CAU 1673 TaxID=3032595 RepID=UPI0023DBDA6F|nr:ligand-binding sensor domain-containing diguanylate cyclase [Aliiglaciecola sp. CAU 1673]MDF2177782.1 diguanylate cyclase [Aliiglaciecola sp. CAU 1673]